MIRLPLAIAFAVIFAASVAAQENEGKAAAEPPSVDEPVRDNEGKAAAEPPSESVDDLVRDLEDITKTIGKEIDETTLGLRISADPVLRRIVCWIAYQPFDVAALASALGTSETNVKKAIEKLRSMGLVEFSHEQQPEMVIPANEEKSEMLRRLADEWCFGGNECGVAK